MFKLIRFILYISIILPFASLNNNAIYALESQTKFEKFVKLNLDLINASVGSFQVTCDDHPGLATDILSLGKKLGVEVASGQPLLPGKDATYEAFRGRIGKIIFKERPMTPEVFCQLITHEFIHVLQHLNGDLKAVIPIGLQSSKSTFKQYTSLQEQEAYLNQNRPKAVLVLLLRALEYQKLNQNTNQ